MIVGTSFIIFCVIFYNTQYGKSVIYDLFGIGCKINDGALDTNTEEDVIYTKYIGPIKIFGEPVKYINTYGTVIKFIDTKSFAINFYTNGDATITPENGNKPIPLDKEHHIKELKDFKNKVLNTVKFGKTTAYKIVNGKSGNV